MSAGLAEPELIVEAPPMAKEEKEHTIDELAALSGVPSRTIRFYQSAGALQKPLIRGRVAFYTDAHLERLKLVADLQDRGLRMKAIGELLGQVDRGELDLAEWLGFEQQLGASWANESPKLLTEAELEELIGGRRSGVLARLVRLGLIDRQGEAFLVKSPGLLQVVMRLESAGIELEVAADGLGILKKHAARAASDLADFYYKRARDGFGRAASTEELGQAFAALRPLSQEALRILFGQEMDGAMRELIESGKAAAIPRKRGSKR